MLTIPYFDDIADAARFRFGPSAPIPVIVSQIAKESGFRPDVISPAGAQGIMQFMPATAKWAATQAGFPISPLDPASAIRGGLWYDRHLYDRVRAFQTECDRWLFTFSAYNGGETRVWQRQLLSTDAGSWVATGYINPGISPANQRENETYGPTIVWKIQPKYAELGPLVCGGK